MKHGKRYNKIKDLVVEGKEYSLAEGVELLKKCATCKFDETVEVVMGLNVNTKQNDQQIRGSVVLPHGIGKTKKVYVIAQGEKAKEAEKNGADRVGYDDIMNDINSGKIEFDVLVTTPDCMRDLGKIGKILGPKGLMPSPKSGTVTTDIAGAIKNIKAGQVAFKMDSYGVVHLGVGKVAFEKEKIIDNLKKIIDAIRKIRPASVKGQFVKNIYISTTMGPGIKLNPLEEY